MARRETARAIDQAAARWAARLDAVPFSSADEKALDLWLAADDRRLGALARASAIMIRADRIAASAPQGVGAARNSAERRERFRLGGRSLAMLATAAALVAAVVVGVDLRPAPEQTFTSARGATRQVALEDGSTLLLNTASQVKVRYSRHRRSLELVSGEALFDVAKDPRRPFIVAAGDTRVRAVGTSFIVQRQASQVDVTVREGVTQIRNTAAHVETLASANMAAVIDSGGIRVQALAEDDVLQRLSWRDGMISFQGVMLGDAARQFARYSDRRIVIDDPIVARRTVTGRFSSTNPEGFAKAAAQSLKLQATPTKDGVRLSR